MKHLALITLSLFATQILRAETLALAGDSTVATYSSGEKQGWGYSFSKYVTTKLAFGIIYRLIFVLLGILHH